jgi:hypothetical protein
VWFVVVVVAVVVVVSLVGWLAGWLGLLCCVLGFVVWLAFV